MTALTNEELGNALRQVNRDCSGHEPSLSALQMLADAAADRLCKSQQDAGSDDLIRELFAPKDAHLGECTPADRARTSATPAQGIETATAAETLSGSVHESPVAKPCAQTSSGDN